MPKLLASVCGSVHKCVLLKVSELSGEVHLYVPCVCVCLSSRAGGHVCVRALLCVCVFCLSLLHWYVLQAALCGNQRWHSARNLLAHSSSSQLAFQWTLKWNMGHTHTHTHKFSHTQTLVVSCNHICFMFVMHVWGFCWICLLDCLYLCDLWNWCDYKLEVLLSLHASICVCLWCILSFWPCDS